MSVVAAYRTGGAIYQALSPDGLFVVSCSENGLSSFAVDGAGGLSAVDSVDLGATPCHVSLDAGCRNAFWTDYLGGRCGSVALDPSGRFGQVRTWRHEGDGPNKPRQDRAHCHQALPSPQGEGFYVVDLGLDRIVRYPDALRIDTAPRGAGPRHMAFGRDGSPSFLVCELGNLVSSFRIRPDGTFDFLDTKPTLPPGDTGRGYNGDLAAAVRIAPSGNKVVVSNRGENSLVSFSFDPGTGELSFAGRTMLDGSWPRDFVFVTDTLAVVALERSGIVEALRYDPEKGTFSRLDSIDGFFRPVALTRL